MILTVLSAASGVSSDVAQITTDPWLEVAKTWVTYIGVLVTAIIVAVAGIRKALKDLKDGSATDASTDKNKVMAATLVETHTMLDWTASNKETTEAIRDLLERLESVCRAVNYNTDALRESNREAGELRHQIERLRDKIA